MDPPNIRSASQKRNLLQITCSLLDQILNSARCCNNTIHSLLQCSFLLMLWNISVTTREVNLNNKPYSSITTWLCITNGVNTNILGVLLLRFPLGRVWFPSASDARVGMASARVLPDPVSVIPTTSLFRELCPFSGLVGWCSRIGQYYAWMVDGRLNLRTSVHL